MKAADIPQTNSTVEVEPFTFFFPLTDKIMLPGAELKVVKIGYLRIDGEGSRYPNALGEVVIKAEVKRIRFKGLDVDPILNHSDWKTKGTIDDIQAAADRHVREVTFAPKPTKENVLKAIIDTVYSLSTHNPLTFSDLLTVRLSEVDSDIKVIAGLVVTHGRQLVVLQGDGEGWPLEATDVNAEKMIPAIYKRLEKLFPNQVKAIV